MWEIIVWGIIGFFLGGILGFTIASILSVSSFEERMQEAYNYGMETGKKIGLKSTTEKTDIEK